MKKEMEERVLRLINLFIVCLCNSFYQYVYYTFFLFMAAFEQKQKNI